jgi:hypothetical protein
MNDYLIGPQEKHRNLMRDKDSNDFFMRFYLLLKFLQNLYGKRHSIGIL